MCTDPSEQCISGLLEHDPLGVRGLLAVRSSDVVLRDVISSFDDQRRDLDQMQPSLSLCTRSGRLNRARDRGRVQWVAVKLGCNLKEYVEGWIVRGFEMVRRCAGDGAFGYVYQRGA